MDAQFENSYKKAKMKKHILLGFFFAFIFAFILLHFNIKNHAKKR